MKILRRYKDDLEYWEEVTMEECLEYTEGRGFWKANTVLEMLKNGQTVQTPYALYKLEV